MTSQITSNSDFNKDDLIEDYESMPASASLSTHMMAGAMAGMMEHVVMYPLDSVKVWLLFNFHIHQLNDLFFFSKRLGCKRCDQIQELLIDQLWKASTK